MPKGQHAKTTSQNGVNGKKAHKKQKQARKPTLTVDTSVLPPQATVPAAVAIQNPVIDVVPAQLPPNAIYQVSNVLQHPAYVVEMQPLQTTALYT